MSAADIKTKLKELIDKLDETNLELRQLPATAFPGVRARVHSGKVGEELAELIRAQGYAAESALSLLHSWQACSSVWG